ncbi:ester cyclase [Fulvivirga sedimenti]|uniref:Ester cyclase n=1 Tax=Fulvivirga sedimenti TaxID=2879465 RepID=A0A9X1HQU3_9BACT|nr:ester cyclase [Fulvivirga sedimenti]MCA6075083.1 ester cyclase [Fulvivirga sedimenti]MCA6076260.1 ester cyclase [Fulvivirga sedimenti]MCA6077388.1 ester cyclase [Fulvivirga sedimenti]
MNRSSFKDLTICMILLIVFISCDSTPSVNNNSDEVAAETPFNSSDPTEGEVKSAVERILLAAGTYNVEDLKSLLSENGFISITSQKDGSWQNREITFGEFISGIENGDPTPYVEIVSEYDMIITDGRLALVQADAVVNRFGIPGKREINNMMLVKDGDTWKLLNIAWTVHELPENQKGFNMEIFARGYAEAWSCKRPGFVAMYFEENGSLQVNEGSPAIGRSSITEVARGFMTDLPDMVVSFDSLVTKSDGTEFHWTLTGTNTGPGGTGNAVKVSGFEFWQMGENNRILKSMGQFSAEEYNRQIREGI